MDPHRASDPGIRRQAILPAALRACRMQPIGVVHSPFAWRDEAPRQSGLGTGGAGLIVLRPGMQNALKDLAGFDFVWVLAWFHRSRGWKPQIVPPRDAVKRGLFATRAPDRPNAIGLSLVRLGRMPGAPLEICDHDLLDGSPVLDLKPYIPAYDARPDARAGWVDALAPGGSDHRLPEHGWMPKRRRDAAQGRP